MPENEDVWFDYGDDKSELRQLMEEKVRLCLAVFDEYGARWRDPMVLATERSEGVWQPWSLAPLVLEAIRVRAGKQLGLARDKLESEKDHHSEVRAATAKKLLEDLDRVERGEQIADEDWISN